MLLIDQKDSDLLPKNNSPTRVCVCVCAVLCVITRDGRQREMSAQHTRTFRKSILEATLHRPVVLDF